MDHVVQYRAPATLERLKELLVSWLAMWELTRCVKWATAPAHLDPRPVLMWRFSERHNSKFREVMRHTGGAHSLKRLCAENGFEANFIWWEGVLYVTKRTASLHRTRLRRYREISVGIARTGRAPAVRTEP